jgi:hypothetical protein
MTSPKPKHIAIVGNVRLTLLGGTGTHRHELSGFTLERRPDANSENWYPAAGYRVEDLDSLAEAVRSGIQFLRPDSQPSHAPEAGDPPETVPDSPVDASPCESPPFEPTGRIEPSQPRSTAAVIGKPKRSTSGRASQSAKTRRAPSKSRSRSRSR